MKNKYPVYIVSKSRWDQCKTGELFERLTIKMGIGLKKLDVSYESVNIYKNKNEKSGLWLTFFLTFLANHSIKIE